MDKRIIIGAGILLVVIGLLMGKSNLVGGTDYNRISTVSNYNITTSATVPQQLLAQNSARSYAVITNGSDTGVYLTLGATTTQLFQKGIWVPAGESYEINDTNLWQGIVAVGTTTAGKIITATEGY